MLQSTWVVWKHKPSNPCFRRPYLNILLKANEGALLLLPRAWRKQGFRTDRNIFRHHYGRWGNESILIIEQLPRTLITHCRDGNTLLCPAMYTNHSVWECEHKASSAAGLSHLPSDCASKKQWMLLLELDVLPHIWWWSFSCKSVNELAGKARFHSPHSFSINHWVFLNASVLCWV